MFSKELEELIDAALADGALTDKERLILHKRAQAEGVDADELDIIINGRLAKLKKQEVAQAQPLPKPISNEKYGNILKCPSCGAQVVGGSAVCPECGYAFTDVKANSSVEKLLEKLDEFNRRQEIRNDSRSAIGGIAHFYGKSLGLDNTFKHKMEIISTFPVPNTRADLLEFLTMIQLRADSTGPKNGMNFSSQDENLSYGYWLLYTNCINKAKISFAKDKDFEPYFAAYEAKLAKTKGFIGFLKCNPRLAICSICLSVLVIFYICFFIFII